MNNKIIADLDNNILIRSENIEYRNKTLKEQLDNSYNYSTNEMIIGKWVDGRNIYRKIITGSVPKNNYYPEISAGITNFDRMIRHSIEIIYGDNEQYFGNMRYTYYYNKEEDKFIFVSPDTASNVIIIAEYIKTTD